MGAAEKRVTEDVLIIVQRDGKLLLAERQHCRSLNGHWSAPGGAIEPGETVVAAARRELREETGLDLLAARFDYWGAWAGDAPDDDTYALHYTAVCLRTDEKPTNTEPHRHSPWVWLTRDEIRGHPVTSSILSPIMRARLWDR